MILLPIKKTIKIQKIINQTRYQDATFTKIKKVRKSEEIVLSEDFSKKLVKDVHENMIRLRVTQMHNKISP